MVDSVGVCSTVHTTSPSGPAFRNGVATSADVGLFEQLGPVWGPNAERTKLDLAFHAIREVTHHGAEIAILRDLYAAR